VLANVLSTLLEKSSRLILFLLEPIHESAETISEQLKLNFAITHVTTDKAALNAFNQHQFSFVLLDATSSSAQSSS
ncbi:hypothetical protein V6260_18800, partial [Pseudoalteromonas aliena]|uniref:hypothetical protein n=1 Tax=Pseudoalteromonas aliena TaxID=247523 RepID=UPI00311F885D